MRNQKLNMKLVEGIWWCRRSFCSSWASESEYVFHYLIPWTSCRISRLKVKSKATLNETLNEQMALYDGTWIMSVLYSQAGCVHSVNAHAIRHIRACLYIRHKVLMPICGRVLPDLSSLWINSRRSGLRLQLTLGPLSALTWEYLALRMGYKKSDDAIL